MAHKFVKRVQTLGEFGLRATPTHKLKKKRHVIRGGITMSKIARERGR